MFLKEFLDKFSNQRIKFFVDMDGVIADFNVGKAEAANYHLKRPLYSSLEKLEEISKMENVELYILSVTRMNEGIEQKNIWLDQFAPFFKKENRIILSREANDFTPSKDLKSRYLKELKREDNTTIIVIDDDLAVIKQIEEENSDIVLLKDTVLVD